MGCAVASEVNFIPGHNPDLVFFNQHGEEREREREREPLPCAKQHEKTNKHKQHIYHINIINHTSHNYKPIKQTNSKREPLTRARSGGRGGWAEVSRKLEPRTRRAPTRRAPTSRVRPQCPPRRRSAPQEIERLDLGRFDTEQIHELMQELATASCARKQSSIGQEQ